jgi:hypothetical protein
MTGGMVAKGKKKGQFRDLQDRYQDDPAYIHAGRGDDDTGS